MKGRAPEWEGLEPYYAQYDHPVFKAFRDRPGAHGPADYIELVQFVKAVRNRTQTPIDVYDSATWSVITPLSEQSVASKSAPVDFPDFTRGRWKTAKPLELEA